MKNLEPKQETSAKIRCYCKTTLKFENLPETSERGSYDMKPNDMLFYKHLHAS